MQRLAGQLQTASFGNSVMFVPSFTGMAASGTGTIGLYDLLPLRSTLERLVDFDLLNTGAVRLTVVAVDLETGDEVLFDTQTDRLGPEHIMTRNALLPDFRPIDIEGYLYGDGGLVSNLPVDVVRREPDEDRLCVAIELFSAPRQRCTTFAEAVARRQELSFVNQSDGFWRLTRARTGSGTRFGPFLISCPRIYGTDPRSGLPWWKRSGRTCGW
jgi:NTE family protein